MAPFETFSTWPISTSYSASADGRTGRAQDFSPHARQTIHDRPGHFGGQPARRHCPGHARIDAGCRAARRARWRLRRVVRAAGVPAQIRRQEAGTGHLDPGAGACQPGHRLRRPAGCAQRGIQLPDPEHSGRTGAAALVAGRRHPQADRELHRAGIHHPLPDRTGAEADPKPARRVRIDCRRRGNPRGRIAQGAAELRKIPRRHHRHPDLVRRQHHR
ncbi:hypothetical protein GALL_443220 [mine drainage metagenome]|uniref:Uncharacterized protein n=1 Tax=mine drainage metagenome TaxID=410659 RepID=A0A1J5Q964_9ZZZZ